MSQLDKFVTDCPRPPGTDVNEILLLLPAHQLSALEVTAARSNRSVAALLRGTIGDSLRSQAPGSTGV